MKKFYFQLDTIRHNKTHDTFRKVENISYHQKRKAVLDVRDFPKTPFRHLDTDIFHRGISYENISSSGFSHHKVLYV